MRFVHKVDLQFTRVFSGRIKTTEESFIRHTNRELIYDSIALGGFTRVI